MGLTPLGLDRVWGCWSAVTPGNPQRHLSGANCSLGSSALPSHLFSVTFKPPARAYAALAFPRRPRAMSSLCTAAGSPFGSAHIGCMWWHHLGQGPGAGPDLAANGTVCPVPHPCCWGSRARLPHAAQSSSLGGNGQSAWDTPALDPVRSTSAPWAPLLSAAPAQALSCLHRLLPSLLFACSRFSLEKGPGPFSQRGLCGVGFKSLGAVLVLMSDVPSRGRQVSPVSQAGVKPLVGVLRALRPPVVPSCARCSS